MVFNITSKEEKMIKNLKYIADYCKKHRMDCELCILKSILCCDNTLASVPQEWNLR